MGVTDQMFEEKKQMSMNLKRLRDLSGLTQGAVARAARVDRSRLALVEAQQARFSEAQAARVRRVLERAIRTRRGRLDAVLAKLSETTVSEATA